MGAMGRGNRMFVEDVRLIMRGRGAERDPHEVATWNMMLRRFTPWSAKSLELDI